VVIFVRRTRGIGRRARDSGQQAPTGRLWHALDRATLESALGTGPQGLTQAEVSARLRVYGPNPIEPPLPASPLMVLIH
jgi:hypothetical protein